MPNFMKKIAGGAKRLGSALLPRRRHKARAKVAGMPTGTPGPSAANSGYTGMGAPYNNPQTGG